MARAGRQLRVNLTINAPVKRVWNSWSNPEQLAGWWGPSGFTNTIHSIDLVPGGEWRMTMHGPDGKNYTNKRTFQDIIPMQKIIFRHFNPNYVATVLFVPHGKTTELDRTAEFETVELFETVVTIFKADEGLMQNVEKLNNYLNDIL